MGDLDHDRILQDGGDLAHHFAVKRGREQKRLTLLRGLGDDGFHGRPKAHVQHAVGLVDDQHVDVAQVDDAALAQIDQATRRCDDNVDALAQLVDLRSVLRAAVQGCHVVIGLAGDGLAHVADLLGKFARGGEHQHARARDGFLVDDGMAKCAHGGQQERGGLAGAGCCSGAHVMALQDFRNGLFLNGGGVGVSHLLDGFERVTGYAEFGEFLTHFFP